MLVLTWCSFLILTGAVVGKLKSNQIEVEQLKDANRVLQDQLQRASN